jgi:DNA-binding NarL/FixJ family response regulator
MDAGVVASFDATMSQSALTIRVLVVDDHPLMRDALASALQGEPDLVVAGLASNGQQALQSYLALRPDVVIMDLMMPVRDGVSATADIMAHDAEARILVLTSAVGDERVVQALAAGAQGYLLKDAEREQILDGVRRVASGELFLPPESAGKLVRALQHSGGAAGSQVSFLSPRQLDVLALAAGGLSDTQIAGRLVLSESTVRVHFHHIIEKLGVADRTAAIAWYEQHRGGVE